MFTVSEEAQKQIADHFTRHTVQPVRIFLHQGCGGAQMAMMVDAKKDTDKVFRVAGFEYLVDRDLLKSAQPISVDFLGSGFRVTSSLELGGGCAGCGSAGSCCS